MRTLIFAIAAAMLISPGYGRPLGSGDEVRSVVAGNTISGVENGSAYDEFYERDGFIRGREPRDVYTGEWRVEGAKLCIRYFIDDAIPEDSEDVKGVPGKWECLGLDVSGSRLTWISGGERLPALLRSGNPDGL